MRKLLLFLLLIPYVTWAQAAFEQGELIIKLGPNENPNAWAERISEINQTPTGLELKRTVSEPFDIFLFTFDTKMWSEVELLSALKASDLVVEAQVNHIITPRLVPNDPLYTSQWQYDNTGQGGGTPGADIDIEGAWDQTTGGLTVDGDTIVVCVIDGGFELSHPDLSSNMWINHAEIDGNGIDDDSNGYVDDYLGWNAYSSNDNITPNNSHGTPVAGIVGAKGDDGYGVAGVNWNVKIMGISGGGNEAEALAAYTYPYVARKRYNETDGDEGAFVVATNASWGVDYGQAADAPLWCAFYDSLGAVGILNAGATINGNVNVDVEGDLPTQCSSDYLISVTNMNNQDEKVTQAGYGATTIDMGAFGAGTYTVASGGGHGSFGGTSGATPHVAGTIALLYAADCEGFIEIAKQNPAQAALMIKDYIFEGLDANTSLVGITTQEGRLNVNTSMQLLLDGCASCPSVAELSGEVTDQEALISWVDSSASDNRLLYKLEDATDWDTVFNASSPYTLDSLDICSTYKVKVQNLCADTTWATSLAITVETGNCCYVVDFEEGQVTETEINVAWGAIPDVNTYTLYYRLDGLTDWEDSVVVTGGGVTNATLSELESCSTYELKLKSDCPEIGQDETIFVETEGCESCTELTYCDADVFSTVSSHISQVSSGSFVKNSGAGEDGYQNFEGTSQFELTRGQSNEITVTTLSGNNAYDVQLWIDFNHNGDFEDDEQFPPFQSGNTFTFNVNIPADALNGITRSRFVHQLVFGNIDVVACNSTSFFRRGEVEDYCMKIVEPLSTEEVEKTDISFYPNPVSDVLNINNTSNKTYHIRLVNILGQAVADASVLGNSTQAIPVSQLPEGMYMIEYSDGGNRMFTKKFVKQ